ncbi:MAG: universal stress protein [Gammaproteobacteria bacterium]|nr:universal stress protein [Gammaproteobacteria bacterium]
MENYRNILVAFDTQFSNYKQVLYKARQMANGYHTKLHLLTVINKPYLPDWGYVGALETFKIQEQIIEKIRNKIDGLGKAYAINPENIFIAEGYFKDVLISKANTLNSDLVIIPHGTTWHENHIAKSILHHTTCDILMVDAEDSTEQYSDVPHYTHHPKTVLSTAV